MRREIRRYYRRLMKSVLFFEIALPKRYRSVVRCPSSAEHFFKKYRFVRMVRLFFLLTSGYGFHGFPLFLYLND